MIELITFFYNEEYLLPFYLKHYDYVDKITAFYDIASTDDTLKILESDKRVKIFHFGFPDGFNDSTKIYAINQAYRMSTAKYCIIADADEFVFRPRFMWRNIYFCKLWQMVDSWNHGYFNPKYLKPSIVKTRKRFKFKKGHHSVTRYFIKFRPFFNTVKGMHLSMVNGYNFYFNRMVNDRIPRQSKENIKNNDSNQFTNTSTQQVKDDYIEAMKKSKKLW